METAMANLELPSEKSEPREGSVYADEPKYPYGLNICLDNNSLIKLGLDIDDFDTGDELHISAVSFVKSKNSRIEENREGKSRANQNMDLQITDLKIIKPEMKLAFDLDEYEEYEDDMGEADLKLKRKRLQLRDLRKALRK